MRTSDLPSGGKIFEGIFDASISSASASDGRNSARPNRGIPDMDRPERRNAARGPRGQLVTRQEFETACLGLGTVVVLPITGATRSKTYGWRANTAVAEPVKII
jgi:hypothetical protein